MKSFYKIIGILALGSLMANCGPQASDDGTVQQLSVEDQGENQLDADLSESEFTTSAGAPANFQVNPRVDSVSLEALSNGRAYLQIKIFMGVDGSGNPGRRVSVFKGDSPVHTANCSGQNCTFRSYLSRYGGDTAGTFDVSVVVYDSNNDFSPRSNRKRFTVPNLSSVQKPRIASFSTRSGSSNYMRYKQGKHGGDVTRHYRVFVNGVHKGNWTSGGRDSERGYNMPKSLLPDGRKNVITIKAVGHAGRVIDGEGKACTYGKDTKLPASECN